MAFLNPSFLWALFAMAIPVIIHLINFRKPKVVYFSNTSFIEDIKKETRTKTKLKQILILIARMLTIAMLVFVFAGPFIPNNEKANDEPSDLSIIYIDNSFSMDADAAKGKVFDQAKQIAKDLVYASDPSMNYIFISNDFYSDFRATLNRDQVITSIDDCKISANSMKINDLIVKANALARNGKNASLYIISDMQKYMFEDVEAELAENVNAVLMSLNPVKINNLYVDTCWFDSPVHRVGQNEHLTVRITNKSSEGFYDIPMQLYLNDSLKAMTNFNVEAGESVEVNVDYKNTSAGNVAARLEISDYPIVYDNVLYFSYAISDKTKVLTINAKDESRYLTALFGNDEETFKFEQVRQGHESDMNINDFDLVVLNSVSEISSGLAERLKTFVNNGGSVCLIPASSVNYASLNSFLELFAIGKFEGLTQNDTKLYGIDYKNNLYRNVFSKEEKQGSLPNMELTHKLNMFSRASFSSVLTLENSAPVLVAGDYGNGKLYVFASPIDNANADFAKSVVFSPAMYNMAMNSQLANSLYATINTETIAQARVDSYEIGNTYNIYVAKDESYLVDVRYNSGLLNVFMPANLKSAGVYGLSENNDTIALLALNYNRNESMQDYLSEEDLEAMNTQRFSGRASIFRFDDVEQTFSDFKAISEGKALWKYFVLLALLFIICEVLIIKFMK
ncbi:MAG: BatA domain-containing protein [Bacteroidales bacterium]|nr:BatA domain-containing protein [Bacteroidales bacterium]